MRYPSLQHASPSDKGWKRSDAASVFVGAEPRK
jgi:hypothetical protein